MIDRMFLEHPRSVDESYVEHAGVAARFGVKLLAGGAACLVHAIVPALFQRTGSDTVRRLNRELTERRMHPGPAHSWQLNYDI